MANKGLQFEWCIFHLVAKNSGLKKYKTDPMGRRAALEYKASPSAVQNSAQNAIDVVEKSYGKIKDVSKKSGGTEPKTDLILHTQMKRLKCSLKYGGNIQLSSGGIKNTTEFLKGVIANLAEQESMSKTQAKELLAILSNIQETLGDIGTQPKHKAKAILENSEDLNNALQTVLGTRKTPDVDKKYEHIKLAIVEEALTGRITFRGYPDLAADHVLSESFIQKIDDRFIKSVSKKTSVRLRLKGRGKKMQENGQEVRMNEIVVSFDTTK